MTGMINGAGKRAARPLSFSVSSSVFLHDDDVALVVVAELLDELHHGLIVLVAPVHYERLDVARELDGTVELHLLVRRDARGRHAADQREQTQTNTARA